MTRKAAPQGPIVSLVQPSISLKRLSSAAYWTRIQGTTLTLQGSIMSSCGSKCLRIGSRQLSMVQWLADAGTFDGGDHRYLQSSLSLM